MEQNGHRKEIDELMDMVANDMGVIAATPEGRDSTRTVVLMNIASSLADIADVLCAGKESIEEDEDGVRKNFFKKNDYWGNDIPSRASEVMKSWLNDHQDEVIQETASMLVEKLWKTKAVKDMVKAVGEEVKEYGSV